MTVNPIRNEETIFHSARGIGSPDERAAYLVQACGEDTALRARVDALLKVYSTEQSSDGVMPGAGSALFEQLAQSAQSPVEQPVGTVIGRYKLLERLGEGGFGIVYMAEQQAPVRRQVALKLLKAGLDTKQVIARFEAERQALAMMDHENIAKVLDAGATDSGRPYFVMELVHGVPITEYCDQNRLSPRQRLELFTQVCRAVQHAHTKGVIHRDLKPTNVLVTLHDGMPVPKVIDFGVAKATGQQPLTDRTLFTQFAQMVGTPLYMSPEQAEMSGLDVDTRSDVYSLGVLLYELLTGTTPFDKDRLRKAAHGEVRRIIREEEPPTPSTRISTLMGDKLATVSAHCKTDAKRLGQIVRGELDWIVMKALEKERSRRYETANGLAMDVQRYLSDDAVHACPPTAGYRLRKFVRRNKAALVTASILVAVLALATVVSAWQAISATRAKLEARREADKQQAGNAFLIEMLSSVNPLEQTANQRVNRTRGTVREMLDNAVRRLDAGALQNYPEIEALVRQTIGKAYNSIHESASGVPSLRKALALSRQVYGSEHRVVADCMVDLSWPLGQPEAEDLARGALAMQHRLFGEEHVDMVKTFHRLGRIVQSRNLPEAELLLRKAVALGHKFGGESRHTLDSNRDLARVLISEGKTAEAEPLLRKTLEMARRILGEDHLDTTLTKISLAELLYAQNKPAEALAMIEEGVATYRKTKDTWGLNWTAWLLVTAPDPANRNPSLGIALAEEAVKIDPNNGNHWSTLGIASYRAGDYRRAATDLEKSIQLRNGGNSFHFFFVAMANWQLGDPEAASQWYQKGVQLMLMEQRGAQNQELARFRAEAEVLLGVAARPASRPATAPGGPQ